MSDNRKDEKDLLRNVSWLFGAKSGKSILVSIELVILARFLGLEKFGLFSLVIAYVDILKKLFDFRVWEATIKYVGDFLQKNENTRALSMIKFSYLVDAVSGIFAFIVSVALAGYGNEIFVKAENGVELIVIYSVFLLFSTANTTSEALFRVFDRFKTITIVHTTEAFVRLIFVCLVLLLGYDIKGVLYVYIASSVFVFVLRQVFVQKILKEQNLDNWFVAPIKPIYGKLRGIFWFLINSSMIATLKMANEGNIAILVLGHFYGKPAAGLYRVARSVIKLMAKIVDPVYEAIYPQLVTLSSQSLFEKSAGIIGYALKNLLKFTIPVAVLILIFTEFIIDMIFGPEYIPAANTMRVLTVAALISGVTFWVTPSLLALGRPGFRTALYLFNTAVYIILLFVLVKQFSYLGAAYAYLISQIVNFSVSLYLKKKLSNEL